MSGEGDLQVADILLQTPYPNYDFEFEDVNNSPIGVETFLNFQNKL